MPALADEQMFARYRINRLIGTGYSGETYEAEDTLVLRKVALKLLYPWGVLSDSARRQFYRELQGMSQSYHPYLAPLLDYGEHEGKLYAARYFSAAGSLLSSEGRAWFKPPLPITNAFHYAHQLAHALDALHLQGYLHGSLTLSNILLAQGLTSEPEPGFAPFLLCDAGLARFVRRFGQPQNAPLPITAAPEQLGQHATSASDQFALAVLLYFWLSGRMPYFGSTSEIEDQKLTGCIIPLRSVNPAITVEQEATIRRALAVQPDGRFPSILAFTHALLAKLAEPATIPETPQPGASPAPSSEETLSALEPEESDMPPLPQASQLIVTGEGEEQRAFILDAGIYTLGRAGSDMIFLGDSSVSRHHALLEHSEGEYYLSDQHSASGVYVDEHKLADGEKYQLVHGNHITIGKYDILFQPG